MKCGFCGKELEEGSEFCPECGMILSLGGVIDDAGNNEAAEVEVPEFTPNVFRAMDFEPEAEVPAMELEVTDEEETAEVVEIIPEYVQPAEEIQEAAIEEAEEEIIEAVEEPEEAQEAEEEETEIQEEFLAPEYDPNAAVSEEFLQQVATEETAEEISEAVEEVIEEATEETVEEVAEEAEEQVIEAPVYEIADEEPEYAPDAYEGEIAAQEEPKEEAAPVYEEEQSYPVYDEAADEAVPEEKPTEDEGLFAALFESAEAENIEDITPENKPVQKSSKKSYLSVAVLVVVLVGIVAAGGYMFKNVLPKIVDTNNTTTEATAEKVDGTTEKETTKKNEKTTAEKTTEKTTAEATTDETETTTEKETTEATTEKAEETTADSGEAVVSEPSEYTLDEVAFFPKDGDISIKAAASDSSADMITHPWGYPVFAYAKEGKYYYVHSPYLDYMGWVYSGDVEEYKEQEDTTAAEEEQTTASAEEQTTAPAEEQTTTAAASDENTTSYLAMIGAAEGLNFRSGPGSDYGANLVVPGGFYVRVTAVSEENPGWVYVTVEDDRYPYGSPSGWVLEEYLI